MMPRPHSTAEMIGDPPRWSYWVSHPAHTPGTCYGLTGTPCPPTDNPCTHRHRTQSAALVCSRKRLGEPRYPLPIGMTTTYCHSCGCSHYYTPVQLDAHRDSLRAQEAQRLPAPLKVCKTPGAVYHFDMTDGGTQLKITVDLPMSLPLDENGAMRLEDSLHDAIEGVLAPYFEVGPDHLGNMVQVPTLGGTP